MKDKDFHSSFPWALAFLVTAICCASFPRVMKLMNVTLPQFFDWIALGALLLAVISGIITLVGRRKNT